jgi:hypothetical protein
MAGKNSRPLLLLVCLLSSVFTSRADEPDFPLLRRLQQVRQDSACQTSTSSRMSSSARTNHAAASRLLLQDGGNSSESDYSHDMTWNSLFHHQPMQQHHAGYKFMLSKQQRQRGISHYGSAERLRAALSRAITSECDQGV